MISAQSIVDALLPPSCTACDRRGRGPFCLECEALLDPAEPFAIDGADRAHAIWIYGGPITTAIQRLKFDGRPELGPMLGAAMRAGLELFGEIDCAVPVPLSMRRLASRGYNQARELARGLDVPVSPRVLARSDQSREQIGLDKRARLANLEHAFAPGTEVIYGRRVVLVDDVVTTGATASAAARALRSCGAKSVFVLALARTQ